MAPQITTSFSTDQWQETVASVLARTGYILPASLLVLAVLVVLYPNRLLFTHPYLPDIPIMPGKKRESCSIVTH